MMRSSRVATSAEQLGHHRDGRRPLRKRSQARRRTLRRLAATRERPLRRVSAGRASAARKSEGHRHQTARAERLINIAGTALPSQRRTRQPTRQTSSPSSSANPTRAFSARSLIQDSSRASTSATTRSATSGRSTSSRRLPPTKRAPPSKRSTTRSHISTTKIISPTSSWRTRRVYWRPTISTHARSFRIMRTL